MMKMFMLIERVRQLSFYIAFIWFSFYIRDKKIFLAYLKTKNLRKDFNIEPADIEAQQIFSFIRENSSILEKYSFTDKESILEKSSCKLFKKE